MGQSRASPPKVLAFARRVIDIMASPAPVAWTTGSKGWKIQASIVFGIVVASDPPLPVVSYRLKDDCGSMRENSDRKLTCLLSVEDIGAGVLLSVFSGVC